MSKEEYLKLYRKYYNMSDERLTERLGELGKKRYINNEIDVFAEHRIAARVQLERRRTGEGLMFHMKEVYIRK